MRASALNDPITLPRLQAHLVDAAHRALHRAGAPVVRAEVPVAATDPLTWLAAQPTPRRFYWRSRGDAVALAAAGEAVRVEAGDLSGLERALTPHLEVLPGGARFFGYSRFAPGGPPDETWAPFGRVRFVLPRFELRSDRTGATFALHLRAGEDVEALVASVVEPPLGAARGPFPSSYRREDTPGAAGWHEAVKGALRAFDRGPLEKVVLARRARFELEGPLDPFALLARLQAETPGCYHVLVGAGEAAFVSASPERLCRVEGGRVETEAVAGTRPRAEAAATDARLRDVLLASEKDRREHAYVRDGVAAALAPLTERLDCDAAASALTLARGRHLYTGIRGTLRTGAGAFDVLRALHPTPAVGGTPTPDALAAIRRWEPFDRGLYAGPVGWIGRDAAGSPVAEFAVGIRAGLVYGDRLDLFSGAGIVAGSDPAAEWAEVEHKIGDFTRVLRLA